MKETISEGKKPVCVDYSAVLHVRHYRVVEWFRDYRCDPWPRLYRRRDDADLACRRWEWSHRKAVENGFSVTIIPVEPVFLPRCAVCAALPDDDPTVYEYWYDLREALRDHPGWVATSEEIVFCPNHQPDHEE